MHDIYLIYWVWIIIFYAHPGFRRDDMESRRMYSYNGYEWEIRLTMPSSVDCRCIAPASPNHAGSFLLSWTGLDPRYRQQGFDCSRRCDPAAWSRLVSNSVDALRPVQLESKTNSVAIRSSSNDSHLSYGGSRDHDVHDHHILSPAMDQALRFGCHHSANQFKSVRTIFDQNSWWSDGEGCRLPEISTRWGWWMVHPARTWDHRSGSCLHAPHRHSLAQWTHR